MRIGFTGAHRSGKTTLAEWTAKKYALQMVRSPASQIIKDFGFDMARDNRLSFRFDKGPQMQWAIYDALIKSIEEARADMVTDRTPIDVAAYFLADATAYACTHEAQATVMGMVQRAIIDTERLFDAVILVPPGIQFVVEEGKPPINEAYQEHHHMLCRGILFDEDLDLYWDEIHRETSRLSDRCAFVEETIQELLGQGLIAA